MNSIYVHFPFCRSRCLYCAFYSSLGRNNLHVPYVNALKQELDSWKEWIVKNAPVKTLYFGGGTPSSLDPYLILDLVNHFRRTLGNVFLPDEITLEVNPEDVNEHNVKIWKETGFTRFSMGVQSMIPEELHAIGRRHSPQMVMNAASLLKNYGDLSLDLICGLPLQTIDSFSFSLKTLLGLDPQHISVYMLELEGDSALSRLVDSGKYNVPDEGKVSAMYLHLCSVLADTGYQHYEISNFAMPGKHSRHNSAYWDSTSYIGLGPSASGYPAYNCRYTNSPDLDSYVKNGPNIIKENLSQYDLRVEYILTRLRTMKGIDCAEFLNLFGEKELSVLNQNAKQWIEEGLLEFSNEHLRLSSPKACLISDAIMTSLI